VKNGTAKNAAALGLPATVMIETEDGSELTANVIWDVEDSSYNPLNSA
jgi:hypothetical protein